MRQTKGFQYRKRYGLHAMYTMTMQEWFHEMVSIPQAVWIACNEGYGNHNFLGTCFNTASGMDCMQYHGIGRRMFWASGFNTASGMDCMQSKRTLCIRKMIAMFQYRKRYGLHAIPSLTALGTAKPRSGFSKRNALLGKSPQTRGIFLSPKTAENVRKPCNIKETFVHGKSMKLMAFSPKSLPSL